MSRFISCLPTTVVSIHKRGAALCCGMYKDSCIRGMGPIGLVATSFVPMAILGSAASRQSVTAYVTI